jgi:hypothetical protein
MIAVGIQKPDMGNVLAVRPGVPLVKGLTPVMNIVLAYGQYHATSFQLPYKANIIQLATQASSPSPPRCETHETSEKHYSSSKASPSSST